MPVSLHLSDHNPDMNESLERCIEKAMLNLLDECVFGGIMITYNTPGFPFSELPKSGTSHHCNEGSYDQLHSDRGPGEPAV